MKRLSWFTPPLPKNQGYAVAAIETIHALQRKQVRVDWNASEPLAHVNFIQPEFYEGHEFQYRIGYTPWESSELPEMWPYHMQRMQEIWTPCNAIAEIYREYKVNDIVRVVPHGINSEIFPIFDRTRADKFVFLHIGGPTERKGGAKVAQAFVDCFSDKDDAFLIMKSHGPSEARWMDRKIYRGSIGNHPRVQVFENEMNEEEINKLYQMAHCCVYPTNGEGFGMIPFQAIATGLPTITTNLLGTADFAELSMPLNASWGDGNGIHLGQWAVPDEDHLRELMLDAYNNWEEHKKKAMQSARIIHQHQTWDAVADIIIDILGERLDLETGIEKYDFDVNDIRDGYHDWVLQSFGANVNRVNSEGLDKKVSTFEDSKAEAFV